MGCAIPDLQGLHMKFNDNTKWKWFAEKHIQTMTVRLYNIGEAINGTTKTRRFKEVEEQEHEPGIFIPPDDSVTLSLDYDEAQDVIQELWNLGFRPSGVESSNEYVQSLKDHILTLQSVNLHFMEVQKGDLGEAMALVEKAAKNVKTPSKQSENG